MKLSLALATYNEEKNIRDCIESYRGLAEEVIVVDGTSTDKTVEIAKSLGAKVIVTSNPSMFHINKQKAIDACSGDWILQLDADERVTPELAAEIKKVISMDGKTLEEYENNLSDKKLFFRHELVTGGRTEAVKEQSREPRRLNEFNAFFIPRLNYFLGKYLRHGGVYPDGVIRLFKRGKAHLPCKDVHELMRVDGKTGWLQNPLKHIDSPTFSRYLERNSRYIDHLAKDLLCNTQHVIRNIKNNKFKMLHVTCYMLYVGINWICCKPLSWFFMTTFRHKGILDGWQGIVFSFFSALRFPRAYWRAMRRF
jgi:glycosyltransferase involved in cell wall biosynthesis